MKLRDYLHDAPWYLHKATLPVRNGLYRASRPLRTARATLRNNRNRRTVARGRRPFLERTGSRIGSRMPLYRARINPATGRPHRDDARIGRVTDRSLLRLRDAHAQRLMPGTQAADRAEIRDSLSRSQDADRARVAAHADKVLGPGRAARAEEALRQARVNPWEQDRPAPQRRSR
jgi:hypothetical protein